MSAPQKIILKGKAKPALTVYQNGVKIEATPQREPDVILNKLPPAAPFKPKAKANGYA